MPSLDLRMRGKMRGKIGKCVRKKVGTAVRWAVARSVWQAMQEVPVNWSPQRPNLKCAVNVHRYVTESVREPLRNSILKGVQWPVWLEIRR
jgi:hypothetical protein